MNYKKIIEDFASGKIDRNKWELWVDKDMTLWFYTGEEADDEARELLSEQMYKEYGDRGYGKQDIVDILQAVGVNADWC